VITSLSMRVSLSQPGLEKTPINQGHNEVGHDLFSPSLEENKSPSTSVFWRSRRLRRPNVTSLVLEVLWLPRGEVRNFLSKSPS